MKINLQKKRVDWIDMARGCAITLVLLAHRPIPTKLSSYIYSFHVPLFFIISGYLLHDKLDVTWSRFIKKKFISLAVPYFFFSLITYTYWLLTRNTGLDSVARAISSSIPLNGTFMAIRNSNFMTHNAALWFICSLFLSEIAFYALYRLVRGDRLLLLIGIVISAITGVLYNTFVDVTLPWSLDTVPIVVVFIGMGFFLREYSSKWLDIEKNWQSKLLIVLPLLAVSLLTWYFNKTPVGKVDMFYSIYGNFFLYFSSALAGSMMIIFIFKNYLTRAKVFTYLGVNSLIIYALHQRVVFGTIEIIFAHITGSAMPFSADTSYGKLGNGLVYLLLTLVILIPVVWLLNKYVPFLVGKGPRKINS